MTLSLTLTSSLSCGAFVQVESLLMDMQLCGVKPDLTTFNNVLFSLSRMPMFRQTPSLVLQTLNEMKNLGIEPSLTSWKHVLTVFYPNDSSDSNMLYKIMDHLEGSLWFSFCAYSFWCVISSLALSPSLSLFLSLLSLSLSLSVPLSVSPSFFPPLLFLS